jgi:hypothetical protein
MPGFVATSRLLGALGDRCASVLLVVRRRKKQRSARSVDTGAAVAMIHAPAVPATSRPAGSASTSSSSGFGVHCPRCRGVYVERLDWSAKHRRVTQRFAMHVGALCREMTNTAVVKAERLHDSTVKDLVPEQVAHVGLPALWAIGVDEIRHLEGARLPHRRQRP